MQRKISSQWKRKKKGKRRPSRLIHTRTVGNLLVFWVFEAKELMAASSSSVPEKKLFGNVAYDDGISEEAEEQLNKQITQTGKALLELAYTDDEILKELDKLENLLFAVRQEGKQNKSLKKVLLPAKQALVRLLRHEKMDVKISVTLCLTEIMRITAPKNPFGDADMKKYFQSAVMAFGKLSPMTGHCYVKALSILEVFADVQLCLVMWDLELDELLVELFKKFFSTLQSEHPQVVFNSMEKIMKVAIEGSEEISMNLLRILLASVEKKNLHLSPSSFKLGGRVLENCASTLKPYLKKAVRRMRISFGDYANIVASICQGATQRENTNAVELQAATSDREVQPSRKTEILEKGKTDRVKDKEKFNANSSAILQNFDLTSQLKGLDLTKQVTENVCNMEKRERRPNSKLKVEEGYDFSWLPVGTPGSKKSYSKKKDAIKPQAANAGNKELGQSLLLQSPMSKNTTAVGNKEQVDAKSTKTLHHCNQTKTQNVTMEVGEDVPDVTKKEVGPSSPPEPQGDNSCRLPPEKSHHRKSRRKSKAQKSSK